MANNPQEKAEAKDQKPTDAQWNEAFAETKKAAQPAGEKPPEKVSSNVKPIREGVDGAKPAPFNTLQNSPTGPAGNMEMILDIPVTVSVELGRTRVMVKELLNLGQGAVVELEKLAGEPMEIMINGALIARGEAVVVNDKFGVKLTDIVSPAERVTRLK